MYVPCLPWADVGVGRKELATLRSWRRKLECGGSGELLDTISSPSKERVVP